MVGAGPSGIAAGAAAKAIGLDVVLLEAGQALAHRWRNHYDRLYLQALRRRLSFPRRPIPRRAGRWVSRDAYTEYLEEFATDSGIAVEFGKRVDRIDPHDGKWLLTVGEEAYRARQVVVATGNERTEKTPDWPGLDSFSGQFMHSRAYRNPEPFVGKDVLVVGGGQTGAEIAVDLVRGGARRVTMAIRTTPIILPRQFSRFFCIQDLLYLFVLARMPVSVLDRTMLLLHRVYAGDLSAYGLAFPADGLVARISRGAGAPILDVGFMRELRAGDIEVVPGVDAFDGPEVVCGDLRLDPDAVIAATGYKRDLEPLVGHLDVLDERGLPKAHAPEPTLPGLYFLGFEFSPVGLLWRMGRQSPRLARTMFRNSAKVAASLG